MSATDWGLLFHYVLWGLQSISSFIRDEDVRQAFAGMKAAKTLEEKQGAAKALAASLHKS